MRSIDFWKIDWKEQKNIQQWKNNCAQTCAVDESGTGESLLNDNGKTVSGPAGEYTDQTKNVSLHISYLYHIHHTYHIYMAF